MKHHRNRHFNCRIEGCGAGFGSMTELFQHKKRHGAQEVATVLKEIDTTRELNTSLRMENARLTSELRHILAELELGRRKLLIIKLFVEEPNVHFNTAAALTTEALDK